MDQVARKVDPEEIKDDEDKRKWKHAYRTPEMDEPVFMHSSSALRKGKDLPTWVVYQEIYQNNGKMYMRGKSCIVLNPIICLETILLIVLKDFF